jgi:hypothetical protein
MRSSALGGGAQGVWLGAGLSFGHPPGPPRRTPAGMAEGHGKRSVTTERERALCAMPFQVLFVLYEASHLPE